MFVLAKLPSHGVRNSAGVFPPLESIAGGIFLILKNCEVRPIHSGRPPVTEAHSNKRATESRVPRARALAERHLLPRVISRNEKEETGSVSAKYSPGTTPDLTYGLTRGCKILVEIYSRWKNKIEGRSKSAEDVDKLGDLVENTCDAMTECWQVCASNYSFSHLCQTSLKQSIYDRQRDIDDKSHQFIVILTPRLSFSRINRWMGIG